MKKIILATLAIALGAASCQQDETPVDNDYQPIVVDTKTASMVTANNQFGFDLFKQLAQDGKNTFISPLSVSQALGMTYNGAAGATAQEMANVLGYAELSSETINETSNKLRTSLLDADKTISFSIANSIWYRNDFIINPTFVATNATYYNSITQGLDFSQAEASKNTINKWVNTQTRGKIPTIVDEIKPDNVMFLINAVYFKGTWKYTFNKNATTTQAFYNNGTEEIWAPMMTQECSLGYYSSSTFSAAELPYGNGHFSMVVILPNDGQTLANIVSSLDAESWDAMIADIDTTAVKLYLPKFKNECDLTLNQTLIDLGMPLAFTDLADFSNMGTPSNLCISKVKHKTFIEVSEEGTEAAAVTSVTMDLTSVGPDPKPNYMTFRVDKPFIYAIREKDTGAIVFIGQVTTL